MRFFPIFLRCLLLIACTSASAQEKTVDLNFEQPLYEHLQNHYLDAITLSEILSEKNGISNIKQQVLLSTSYYNYQLPELSLDLLKKGLTNKINKNDEDILLFHIAKNHYNDQSLETALIAFNKITSPINPKIKAEINYLKADILIRQNELEKAHVIALKLQGNIEFFPFTAHNLAIAYLNNKHLKKALFWINTLNNKLYPKHQNLKDSLLLSSGILYLRQKNYPKAIHTLLAIKKESTFAAKGLLALGKSLVLDNNMSEAKRFFNYLSNYPKQNIYYQESLLSLAESDNTHSKKLLYKHAISHYNDLLKQINILSSSEKMESISECLVKDIINPICQDMHLWLDSFVLSEAFNSHLIQNKQLLHIQHTLFNWSQKLNVFQFTLKQRQDDFEHKMPKINNSLNPIYLLELQQQFEHLKHKAQSIKHNFSPFDLMNDDESDQLIDINYVDVSVKRITSLERSDKEFIKELQTRAHFTKGILMWDLAQKKPIRLRQVRKNIVDLETLLNTANDGMTKLKHFNQTGDNRLTRLSFTLKQAKSSLHHLHNQVDRLIAKNQQQLTTLTQEYLWTRKVKLIYLNSRSKFLLTQLQDVQE